MALILATTFLVCNHGVDVEFSQVFCLSVDDVVGSACAGMITLNGLFLISTHLCCCCSHRVNSALKSISFIVEVRNESIPDVSIGDVEGCSVLRDM